ncbi:hypothetical protein OA90_13900 [Labrenzia sp. OB1]|nr:hypothetical protein OA90_13900 [Labrenzia sp. OB1]
MMLSSDLRLLSRQLNEWKDDRGALSLCAQTASRVEQILDECISIARHLEASRVQRSPIIIDLSDPKIALFPIARRPIPVVEPVAPGTTPVSAPATATPVTPSYFDDDGAA